MIYERDDDQSRPPEMHQMTSHARRDLRPPEMHQMTSHARRGLRSSEMYQITSHAQIRHSSNLRKDPARVRLICAQIRRYAWVSGNVLLPFSVDLVACWDSGHGVFFRLLFGHEFSMRKSGGGMKRYILFF
ncbi:hypothetical protein Fot_02285 [Forsythia ovata]|uniref:Uncharacterized protein n=1 Tax=Forsythia ovata TaxID=205694 RepID=A0ABD1X6F1_9LAMI